MRFLLYKFSQSPIITFLSVAYSVFSLLFFGLNLSAILSVLLALISFAVIFIPFVAFIYPIFFLGYMVAAVILVPSNVTPHHGILIAVLVLTVLRFAYQYGFAVKKPSQSQDYDEILRRK